MHKILKANERLTYYLHILEYILEDILIINIAIIFIIIIER